MAKLKLCVLISGRGSNLQALIDACADRDYPAEITLVVSNSEEAPGLGRARAAGIPVAVVDHRDFSDRQAFDIALDKSIGGHRVDLVCLAGFMRILGDQFVDKWRDRLINIHPSLLPAFKGLNVQQRAIDAGVRLAGCTVHFVRPAMDDGPIILQAAVPVLDDDDADTLAARILEQEHRIYPEAVRLIAEKRVVVEAEKVRILS